MSIYSPSYSSFFEPYKFSVYRNAALSVYASATVLVYDSKNFDTGNNFSTSTGKFTAPINGFYWFDAAYNISSGSNAAVYMYFYQNSTDIAVNYGALTTAIQSNESLNLSRLVQMTAGDTLYVQYSNSAGTLGLNVGPQYVWFDGFLVSAT
jgi:hypothetical protein